jgi:hypothetical protein
MKMSKNVLKGVLFTVGMTVTLLLVTYGVSSL